MRKKMNSKHVNIVPTTLKLFAFVCIALGVSNNAVLPSEPIDSVVIGDFGDPPPPADDDNWWDWFFDWGIRTPITGGNPVAAPYCEHGIPWGCSKCGHMPPTNPSKTMINIRPAKLRGVLQPPHRDNTPMRPKQIRAVEIPSHRDNKWHHYVPKPHRSPTVRPAVRLEDTSELQGAELSTSDLDGRPQSPVRSVNLSPLGRRR